MDDLIGDVGIDGKHSYEDAIIPAEEFQVRFGDRIAVLGGVDLDILSAGSTSAVRHRTRELVETCGPRGPYAVGSGNSIPTYVPLANYLAMVDGGAPSYGGALRQPAMSHGLSRIRCVRCEANNFPGKDRCWQCGAALPPPEALAQQAGHLPPDQPATPQPSWSQTMPVVPGRPSRWLVLTR